MASPTVGRWLWLAIVLLAGAAATTTACSENQSTATESTDGSATPGALPLKNGQYLPVPEACAVTGGKAPPYLVTFRFTNSNDAAAYVSGDCQVQFQVSSCAGNYTDDVGPQGGACPCATEGICPVGGPCGGIERRVNPGESRQEVWPATLPVTVMRVRECSEQRPLPPGRYRVRLPVFSTEEEAMARSNPQRTITKDFTLPAPNDVVEVIF